MDFQEAKRRYEFHLLNRKNVEGVWDLIQKFVLPFRAIFNTTNPEEGEIDWRRREIYDDTAVDSAQSLAATINSNLTNPVLRWFSIIVKNKSLNALQEVRVWLEEVSERIFQVFQSSNFNLAASEVYLDLVGFGIGTIVEEVVEQSVGVLKKIIFKSVPVDECFFDEDSEGRAINFYRLLRWTPLQIFDKFGKDGTPSDIMEMISDPEKSSRRLAILCVIFRRKNIPLDIDRPVAPKFRPYGAKYFRLVGADLGSEQIGQEQGYYEMPAFIPRWRKVSGSQFGYSPAMVVLSTILSLNKIMEIVLAANEKIVDPPILSTRRGIIGDYDLRAGRVTPVQSINEIQQWEFKGRLDFGMMSKEDLAKQVREAFFVDQLQLKESPAMTATEVAVRYQLMQKLVGPTVGQIQYDFLGLVIKRTFNILLRYGLLPEPPQVLRSSGASLEIEYLGPMAKAQRQDVMMAIERWIGGIVQASKIFPEALDIPNVDETVRELGYAAGVPAKLINSNVVVMRKRAQQQAQQAQVQRLAMAQGAGEAMQKLGAGMEAMKGGPVQESQQAA